MEPRIQAKVNQAKSKALKQGNLSAYQVLKDPDYEPTDCMQLFAPYGPRFSNGKWLLNQFITFRDGTGVTVNGQAPCNGSISAWTVNPGSGYPFVFICPRAFDRLSQAQAATKLIHEALHVAGLREYPNPPTAPRSAAIDAKVRQNCRR